MSEETPQRELETSRSVREDLAPLPEGREPGFSRPRLSRREKNAVILAAALGLALAAGISSWNARRYLTCSDLLGTHRLGADVQCNWNGSDLNLSFPKAELSTFSGPIRQLYSGTEQVAVKGYVLHWDRENSRAAAGGPATFQTYSWRALGPPHVAMVGGPTLIVHVVEDDRQILVHVTHHEFGFWDWLRGNL